ncbi:MAG TPA: exodeoxyribonuclease VII large subunit [Candidatus Dojkabacteria bacterium]|nr:exodeoxyribonuclease VII large subunit [Candidatus Dojkabacteria bacterium]
MTEDLPRLSVSNFNELIDKTLRTLGEFIIEGEITQISISGKGGVNIILKDTKHAGILNISGYAPRIEGINLVKTGMQVAVWGTPQLYVPYGKFSLSAYKIIPLGAGALKEAYEQLKKLLETEGLFNIERKRPLPEYLTRIALITAKDSAAYSDFVKILKERRTGFQIDFYPVPVQGKYAESTIISTLKYLEQGSIYYDCLVLTRGGGSLEDLLTFNSERLARILFGMPFPVVVAVGHERDESIADFVADIRAATPSQAAYYLAHVNENFFRKLEMLTEAAKLKIRERVQILQSKLQLSHINIMRRLSLELQKISGKIMTAKFILQTYINYLNQIKQNIQNIERLLNSFNPLNILKKGYSIIKDEQGRVVVDYKKLQLRQKISVNFYKGSALAQILKIFK